MKATDFSPEQRHLIASCKSTEELLALVKKGSIELSDWQLERVVGGVEQGNELDLSTLFDFR